MIELNSGWRFVGADAAERPIALDVDLPFDSVSSLAEAGVCPEPYAGLNAENLRWIAEGDWVLSRTFTVDETALELLAEGLDGIVDLAINGQPVLSADNSFRTWRADLSEVLRAGENDITLTFRSVIREAQARQDAQPRYVPYHKDNCAIPHINMLRKPQCDFGWDWNAALAPFGVTGGLVLRPVAAARISRIQVDQDHHDGATETVSVTVTAELDHVPDGRPVEIRFGDQLRQVEAVRGKAEAKFVIEMPDLWWPAGQGAQTLYDLELRCGDAVATRRIGLRRLEHVTLRDDLGLGFKFRVNGRDVFAKGANWIPADALSGRITREKTRDLLQSAVDANMNMIRVWGGGRYEPDWFYDLCDELGLMVWQDLMFACNLYPNDPDFLANVGAEVREQVERLGHHACLALWCGDNEIIGMLRDFPETRDNTDPYLVAYDRLNHHLELALKAADPKAHWWPSSPSLGPLNFGDAWHNDSSGDMHVWTVWHENKPFEAYRELTPRFVSEFGFQSFPSLPVMRACLSPEEMNLSSPAMDSHQKNQGGNARIVATMMREFRLPERLDDMIYLSQLQQGLALKTAVTNWRAQKGHCWGTLYWQLNDTWPCASWSTLDYGGGWKLGHHIAKQFYAPMLVTVVPGDDGDRFKIINDFAGDIDVSVQVMAVTTSGVARPLSEVTISASPSKALELFTLPNDTLRSDEIYVFTWQYEGPDGASAGSDFHSPRAWKEVPLKNPDISISVSDKEGIYDVELAAQALAVFVTLEADQPGRFSGNAITLLPGQPAKISFVPEVSDITPKFTIRDLYGATCGEKK